MLAQICKIDAVEDHFKPTAAHLSVVTIGDKEGVSMKVDGQPRYASGALVMAVFEGAVVPEYLLKQGFWLNGAGTLAGGGKKKNRMKPTRFQEQLSEFILFPVEALRIDTDFLLVNVFQLTAGGIEQIATPIGEAISLEIGTTYIQREDGALLLVADGDDVAEFMGITTNV